MKTAVVALLSLLAVPAAAFAPLVSRPAFTRKGGVAQSHFSTVQTQLKDKDLLVGALEDIGVTVIVGEAIPVRGYNGQITKAEVAVAQENGQDIGFRFNGNAYEMVADLEYWGQSSPADFWLEKLTKQYSVNAVMNAASEGGFATEQFVENKETGVVQIELSRYVA